MVPLPHRLWKRSTATTPATGRPPARGGPDGRGAATVAIHFMFLCPQSGRAPWRRSAGCLPREGSAVASRGRGDGCCPRACAACRRVCSGRSRFCPGSRQRASPAAPASASLFPHIRPALLSGLLGARASRFSTSPAGAASTRADWTPPCLRDAGPWPRYRTPGDIRAPGVRFRWRGLRRSPENQPGEQA